MTIDQVTGVSAPVTTTFQLRVYVTTDGDPDEMRGLIAEYLTEPESPFIADYGAIDIWGGYPGPFIRHVSVVHGNQQLAYYDEQEHL